MKIQSYKELVVWQKSYKLCLEIYQITKSFPREELYGIVSQIRRAAVSVPSNIAEGYCRHNRKEYLQFLYISYGSGAELETQLSLVKDLKYISEEDYKKINLLTSEVMRMLNVLVTKLNPKR